MERMYSVTLITARPPFTFNVGTVHGECKEVRLDTRASLHFTFFNKTGILCDITSRES